MDKKLQGLKVAVLLTDGFEQFEYTAPRESLINEGAEVATISQKNEIIPKDEENNTGVTLKADLLLGKIDPDNFDALLLPGGIDSVENLRMDMKAIQFIQHFIEHNKPIAALSFGPWLIIESNGVRNKKITSDPSIQADFINAEAYWENEDVVTDGNLVTCKGMNNFSDFTNQMCELFSKSDEMQLQILNEAETKDERIKNKPTDAIGENPTKKWGVSEFS